jgi:hypothetical protein
MVKPYTVATSNEYAYVGIEGLVNISIKQEAEGIVIDVWNKDQTEVIQTMAVWYEDMEGAE